MVQGTCNYYNYCFSIKITSEGYISIELLKAAHYLQINQQHKPASLSNPIQRILPTWVVSKNQKRPKFSFYVYT